MFWTVRAGAPRRVVSSGSSLTSAAGAGSGSLGTGAAAGLAVLGASGRGCTSVAGVVLAAALAGAGRDCGVAAGFWGCFAPRVSTLLRRLLGALRGRLGGASARFSSWAAPLPPAVLGDTLSPGV